MANLFNKAEKKLLYGLSLALALRQLGMLLVLPFLSIFGESLAHSTSFLVGLSLGIFGLSQGLLQIPFGILSDKIGRKKPLLLALFIFTGGLVAGYLATNIYTLIAARTLQGCGAVAVVAFSWIGDRIDETRRNRAMALPGIFIGVSSVIAFIGGPLLYKIINVPQMFLVCAVLSSMSFLYVLFFLEDQQPVQTTPFHIAAFWTALKNRSYIHYYIGGLTMNACLVSVFFVLPLLLKKLGRVEDSWIVFVPAVMLAMVVMRKATSLSDSGKTRRVLALACFSILCAALLLNRPHFFVYIFAMIFFMSGYMTLATVLPATVTKLAPDNIRGSVTGVLNTMQFIGSFAGGTLAGTLWDIAPFLSILLIIIIAALTGLIFLIPRKQEVDKQGL